MIDMTRRFWTPERDAELERHKAAGLSASRIAALLQTTRGAILGRTKRLRESPSPAEIDERKRLKREAAEARRKTAAEKRRKVVAEGRRKAPTCEVELLAAMQADLAAGVDRDEIVQSAIAADAQAATIAAFLGLLPQGHDQPLPGTAATRPEWTDRHVAFLQSMWLHYSAQEIADALGVTRNAILGRVWRAGLRRRKSRKFVSAGDVARQNLDSDVQASASIPS
jgi:hypothetical protein